MYVLYIVLYIIVHVRTCIIIVQESLQHLRCMYTTTTASLGTKSNMEMAGTHSDWIVVVFHNSIGYTTIYKTGSHSKFPSWQHCSNS